jgi:hypothetical protein
MKKKCTHVSVCHCMRLYLYERSCVIVDNFRFNIAVLVQY